MAKKQKRRFIISEDAWYTMQQYAKIAHDKDGNEISGMLCLRKIDHPISGDRVWELFDPVILKQENTSTTTELDKDSLTDYYVKMGMKHGAETRFCWWHSHHTMNAFWSGTDLKEINAWKNESWSLALVINLFEEYCLNVSTWDPVEHTEDVPLEILRNKPAYTDKQVKEYEELCDKPAPVVVTNYNWTNRYKQVNQTGLWSKPKQYNMLREEVTSELMKDEKLDWTSEDTTEHNVLYNEVLEDINDAMYDITQGKMQYTEYSTWRNALNSRLHARSAKMVIPKIKKAELLNKASANYAADWIKYDSENIEQFYETVSSSIDSTYGGYNYYGLH